MTVERRMTMAERNTWGDAGGMVGWTRTANVERTRQRIGLWTIGQSVGLDDHRQEKCLDARPAARRGGLLQLGEGRLANEDRRSRIN